jgi:hypothetical protein
MQSGFSLIVALIMLALLSLFAAGVLTAVTTESRIAENYRREAQLLYLAEAGIEDGREIVRQTMPITVGPLVQNKPFLDTSGRQAGLYSLTLVRTNPVTLRSVGVIGSASKNIDVRLKKTGFPATHDAITLDEDVPLPPDLDPRLATTVGLERIVEGILKNATDVFRPPLGEAANLSVVPGSLGSADDYRVVVVEGDCVLGNATGHGVLLVRGELTLSGTFAWHGLVLVVGQGVVRSADVVTGSISGALFLARTRESDRSDTSPLGTLRDTRGNVTLALPAPLVSVGRSDAEILQAGKRFPYVATSYREY